MAKNARIAGFFDFGRKTVGLFGLINSSHPPVKGVRAAGRWRRVAVQPL